MSDKTLYINIDTGKFINASGGQILNKPTISYKAQPVWELHFVQIDENGTMNPVDMSSGVAWRAAIDSDFDSATQPMVRTLDDGIDKTDIANGVLYVSLDANTDTFLAKVDKKSSIAAYFEVRGTSSDGRVIYDYRFDISALGAIDPSGSDPLPVASGAVSEDQVLALLRASRELQFSTDGINNWHTTRVAADNYYRERYPQGEWTEAILIVNGTNGAPAPNVKIQYAEAISGTYHDNPLSSDYYLRFSNDDASTWSEGALFRGKDGTKTAIYDLGTVSSQITIDINNGNYQKLTLAEGSFNFTLYPSGLINFTAGDSMMLEVNKPTSGCVFNYKGKDILENEGTGIFLLSIINNGSGYLVTAPSNVL